MSTGTDGRERRAQGARTLRVATGALVVASVLGAGAATLAVQPATTLAAADATGATTSAGRSAGSASTTSTTSTTSGTSSVQAPSSSGGAPVTVSSGS